MSFAWLRRQVLGVLVASSSMLGVAQAETESPFAGCEARFAADPSGWSACDCFYGLAQRQGLVTEALRRLSSHLATDPQNPCLQRNLGRLHLKMGDTAAGEHLRAAIAGYSRLGNSAGEVYSRLNLGSFLRWRGDGRAAWEELGEAEKIARNVAADLLLAEIDMQHARWLLEDGGALVQVEKLLRRVEALVTPETHPALRRMALTTLGSVLHQLGRHAEAEACYEDVIEVTRAVNDPIGEAWARYNLAITSLARPPTRQTRERSIALLKEALADAVSAGFLEIEAETRLVLGRLLGGEQGRIELVLANKLARELGTPTLRARALAGLASQIVEREPELASGLLQEMSALEAMGGGGAARLYGWFDRLKVGWAISPRSTALAQALEELAEIERLRERQGDSLTRAEIFSVWADAYSWLAGHLLEARGQTSASDLDLAFELLERRHARVLLEAAGAQQGDVKDFARLEEICSALAEDEALLFFQQAYERDVLGDFAGGSWLLVITRGGMHVSRTIDPLEVDPRVPTFVSLLARRDGSEAEGAAGLSRGLLGDALAALPTGIDRLVIVPDEDLHLLPFAALRASPSEPALAERYELEIVPSATLWLRWRQAALAPASPAVLALADPELGDTGTVPAAQERGWTLKAGQPLGALPHARREGRRAVRALGAASELRVGKDASEHSLKSADLRRFGLLHFAAHAVVDGERSERSAIVLAASENDDGLLEPAEIRALDLSGKAVVLSACRSAVGDVLAGEGPLSLAHAFFAAGARTVVASLWPLRDDEAARFFDRFYRHLARGESAGSALAASQREMIAAGEPAAIWAGVVLLGDADWRIEPVPAAGLPWLAVLFVLAGSSLVGLGLWYRHRRRRTERP